MGTLVIRCVPILCGLLLLSCGGSDPDLKAYRKSPQVCDAAVYFAALPNEEKLHYVLGALHVKPQAPCIADLLSKQNIEFLRLLQKEIAQRGYIYDRYAFIEAVIRKSEAGGLDAAQLEGLALDRFCLDVSNNATCSRLLQKLSDVREEGDLKNSP